MDDPFVVSYSLLGNRAPGRRGPGLPDDNQRLRAQPERPEAKISKLLPADNFDPESYWQQCRQGPDPIIESGMINYLRQITAGQSNLDHLVLMPILEEQAFLSGNSDFYAWSAGQSLFRLAPYLTACGADWEEQSPLAQRRQVAILNALVGQFLPIVDQYLQLEEKLAINPPQITDLQQASEIIGYLQSAYRRWLPRVPEENPVINDISIEPVFRYSGWAAAAVPGLLSVTPSGLGVNLGRSFASNDYLWEFPVGLFWTTINSAYHHQPQEHWRQYEDELFAALVAGFEWLVIELIALKTDSGQ